MKLSTFDIFPSDWFDGDFVVCCSIIASKNLSVLTRSYFSVQDVVVNEFWHDLLF